MVGILLSKSRRQSPLPPTKIINLILNGTYREPIVAIAVALVEIAAGEAIVARVVRIAGRGRPIVALAAHIVDIRAGAVARRRQEHSTSCLHLRPLGKRVAVV